MHTSRNSLELENATIVEHNAHPEQQYILKLHAPRIANTAQPGSFVYIRCHPQLDMRRPLSIMRTFPQQGEIEILYKVFGHGTQLLSEQHIGDTLSVIGPIGIPFKTTMRYPRPLLIGGGVGIPPMIFLADSLRQIPGAYQPFVIMGSEIPFPFTPKPSQKIIPGMPDGVIASMPLLEDWGIASRLSSLQNYPGCYFGYVTDLAKYYLDSLSPEQLKEVIIYSCGPHPMLAAVAQLAKNYHLPCQVSLEEFMACAVGGCAGCVVEVKTSTGIAMQRVCVDGPVFDAQQVFF